jgi:K+-sensing histidine kinase KdpD
MPPLPDKAPLLKDDMPAYLYVAVTDTGPGLTPKELDMLFQRFSQVSRMSSLVLLGDLADDVAKTHTIFGGSGLGLFVCRSRSFLLQYRTKLTPSVEITELSTTFYCWTVITS